MTTLEEKINTLRGKSEWDSQDNLDFDTYQEIQTFKREAEKLALKEYYLQLERMKIKAGKNLKIFSTDLTEMESYKESLKEEKLQNDPKYALFITINPECNDISGYTELNKRVEKCVAKYWITDYAYCYEQRSTDAKLINGLHCHILLTRGTHKPSHCEREIRSTFSSLCGNSKHINIQYKKKDWIKDKLQYMLGDKTGDGKDLKTPIDTIMRETLGIEKIKYSGYSDFFSQV